MTTEVGRTGIVVPLPVVDKIVGRWRLPLVEPGMPAHVTLLFPFKPLPEVTEADVDRLRSIVATEVARPIRFERSARFPGVLYLAPEQDGFFRGLTEQLVAAWPDYPPYGGAFDDVVPHLTVAFERPEPELDEIQRELDAHLPIEVFAEEACLMRFDGTSWECEARAPLAAPGEG